MAIAVNTIDIKYSKVAQEIEVCGLLRFCDKQVTDHPEIEKSDEVILDQILGKFEACQDNIVKESIVVRYKSCLRMFDDMIIWKFR